jgi:hypothetical protein
MATLVGRTGSITVLGGISTIRLLKCQRLHGLFLGGPIGADAYVQSGGSAANWIMGTAPYGFKTNLHHMFGGARGDRHGLLG